MSETGKEVRPHMDFEQWKEELKGKVKGEDPVDLNLMCVQLCKNYLGGKWSELTDDVIQIKRLTGGMVNMVYHCKIPDHIHVNGTEPKEVVIRVFGKLFDPRSLEMKVNWFEANIKYVLLSEAGIGPEVYGVAQNATIQKYYQHRPFSESDLNDKELVEQMARKLARMHSMKPPIDKSQVYHLDILKVITPITEKKFVESRKIFAENNCKTLLDFDIKAETDWVLDKIKGSDSPVVFLHGDFRFGNIMVTEDKRVILGDFDASTFFHRGYDFATLFGDYLKLDENSFRFKDESVVKYFVEKYLTENAIINGKQYLDNEINSVDHIMREIELFCLMAEVIMVIVFLNNEFWKLPFDENTLMHVANSNAEKYLKIKMLLAYS